MRKLYIMTGVSYSGKSLYAQRIAQTEHAAIISLEQIKGELYGDVSMPTTNQIMTIAIHRTLKAMTEGDDVVFDALLSKSERMALMSSLKKTYKKNFYTVCIYCPLPEEAELEYRRRCRKRETSFNEIGEQIKKFEIPSRDEFFNEVWMYDGQNWCKL